jgi:polysaccharide chain length determinant protein (PEP-CTERM system associated)
VLPGRQYEFHDYLRMAWRWSVLLTVLPMIGLFLALVVSSRIQDLYQSDMLIQIVPQRVPESFVRSTVTIRTEDRIQALSEQLMSRTQLERMVQEFDLYPAERSRLPMEDVLEGMRSNVEFVVDKGAGLDARQAEAFHIRFKYRDPRLAARVTESLGSLIVDQNAQDRGALAEATNEFLEAQLAQARARLEAQEQKREQFRKRNTGQLPSQLEFNMQIIQNTQLQLQALVESIARDRDRRLLLMRMYSDAQTEAASLEAAAASAPALPGREGAGTPPMTAKQQLDAARAALSRLQLRLRPEHPDVVRATRVIADLEQKAAAEAKAVAEAVDAGDPEADIVPTGLTPEERQRRERLRATAAEIDSLDRQVKFREAEEQRLKGTIADYQRRIESVPGVESEWVSLTRDYDTQQAAYRELLVKSEASKVSADLERRQIGEQFRVLDPARLPVRPIPSKRLQINAGGLVLGLLLGAALAFFLEVRDSSFQTEADVLEVLGIPVVALVPNVESVVDRKVRRRRRLYVSTAATVIVATGGYAFWMMKLWKYIA